VDFWRYWHLSVRVSAASVVELSAAVVLAEAGSFSIESDFSAL